MTEEDKRLVRISSRLKKYKPDKCKRLITRGLIALSESKKAIDWISNGFKLSIFPNESYEEALKAFNKAIEIEPNNTYAWWYKGFILFLLSDYKSALNACNRAIELNTEDDSAWVMKGWVLNKLEAYEESFEAFLKAMEIGPKDADKWFYLGCMSRDYNEALKAFENAIEMSPNHGPAWIYKYKVFDKLGYKDEASKALQIAWKSDVQSCLRVAYMGSKAFVLGYYMQRLILKAHDKMTDLKPNDFEAWYNKGLYLTDYIETFGDSLEPFKKALELNPDDANVWYYTGWVLYKVGNFEKSLEASEKAIELNSEFLENAWYNKGDALFSLGRYEQALEAFNKAIELKTDIDDVWYKKALIFSLLGDKKNALKDLSKAISLSDSYKEQAKNDDAFRNLWSDEEFKKITN